MDALVEAIGIIRAVWGTGTVREVGEHYRVDGLHAGPRPAHDIPLWIGAYKPRMIRVTADLANAWIPSMGYADPPALADLNARLDDRAEANGRGPQAIRRMYNVFGRFGTGSGFLQGHAADWAEQLAGLAIDEGISTFILGTDDPDTVRRFALEVAPARSAINTMTMRQNNWTLGAYCESYCRIVTGHHSLEDHSMFRYLRRADPAAAPVVDRLAEEHVVIHDVLEQVDRALVELVSVPAGGTGEALERFSLTVDLLTDTLLSHLSYEERELLHPLAQHGMG